MINKKINLIFVYLGLVSHATPHDNDIRSLGPFLWPKRTLLFVSKAKIIIYKRDRDTKQWRHKKPTGFWSRKWTQGQWVWVYMLAISVNMHNDKAIIPLDTNQNIVVFVCNLLYLR